jgi:hypothetical protein
LNGDTLENHEDNDKLNPQRDPGRTHLDTAPWRTAFRPLQRPGGRSETIGLWLSNGEAA